MGYSRVALRLWRRVSLHVFHHDAAPIIYSGTSFGTSAVSCQELILVGHIGPVVRLVSFQLSLPDGLASILQVMAELASGCTRTHDCSAGRWLRRI